MALYLVTNLGEFNVLFFVVFFFSKMNGDGCICLPNAAISRASPFAALQQLNQLHVSGCARIHHMKLSENVSQIELRLLVVIENATVERVVKVVK